MADFDKFNKFNIYSRRSLSSIQNPLQAPVASGTFNLLDSPVGTLYNYQTASLFTGGTPTSYEWAGSPPPWAALDPLTGDITGTSTEGTWAGYAVIGTNATGSDTTNTDSVTIQATAAAPIASGTFDLSDSEEGTVYNYPTSSLFTGGDPTSYAWSGTPPTWATLNTSTGVITGTSTEGSWSSFAVVASNSGGSAATNTDTVTVTAALLRHYPDYLGYTGLAVSAITPVIDAQSATGLAPCVVQCSAATSTATGTTKTGEAVNPKTHIEYRWRLLNANGDVPTDWVNNGQGTFNPVLEKYVSDFTDQVGPIAHFPIYDLEPQIYTVLLIARAPDGSGGYTVASTTSTFEVTGTLSNLLPKHVFVDGVTGDDANTGVDPFGSVYTGGTYDSETGILTATGAFATAFAGQIAQSATVSPVHRNNYHFIEGVTRRGEYLDGDRFQVAMEDRTPAITATGLSSVATSGPTKTLNAVGRSFGHAGHYYHVNGNAGTSSYIQTIGRMGQSLYWDNIAIIGYNGDPANDYRVEIIPDGSFTTQPQVYSEYKGIHFISNIFANCSSLASRGFHGYTGTTDATVSYNLIYDNTETKEAIGTIAFVQQDGTKSGRASSQVSVIGGRYDNKKVTGSGEKKHVIFATFGKEVWLTVRGLGVTGDSDNNILDHYIYNSGYTDRQMWTCVHAYGADDVNYKPSYMLNATCSITAGEDNDLYFTADNKATECDYYSDASNVNNTYTGGYFANILHARNLLKGHRDFIYDTATYSTTLLSNTFFADREVGQYSLIAGTEGADTTQNDIFLDDNAVYNGRLHQTNNSFAGLHTHEFINNNAQNLVSGQNTGEVKTSVMGAAHYYENNYYNGTDTPLASVLDEFDGALISAATLNSRLLTATGYTTTNTEVAPDWQDAANNNFLPVGFESAAPVVLAQPVSSVPYVSGDYANLSVTFDEATAHQWQLDGVDITGETSPVIAYKMLAGDEGKSLQCIGTNAFGSTTSNTVSFV